MAVPEFTAALTMLAVLGAAGLGLLAHLGWLLVTAPREFCAVASMFARVVVG